ncbi:MAG: inositol monophosphatase family protein [Chloroflexota bacterium]
MPENDLSGLLETAHLAARQAGQLLLQKWREPQEERRKGFRHWVTDADIALQETITTIIRERYPTHGFLAEEESSHLPAAGDAMWIIDPIDGTTNFSRGQPNFCISIAAARRDRMQIGVIFDPLRDELFSASCHTAARLNDDNIQVSDTEDASQVVIGFDWAHSPDDRQATLNSLQSVGHAVRSLRSIGSAALALAWVACGRLDAYWNWHLNAWDVAAGALIVEQAGGRCTDIEQRPLAVSAAARSCLATNSALHSDLSLLLRKPPATR